VTAAANQFGAGRENLGYTINPGGRVEDGIVVANSGSTPLHVALRAADGFDLKDAKPAGVRAWVRLGSDDLTVAPGESITVPFTLTPPRNAAAGDYAGGIVTSSGNQRVGIPIRLRVGGALKPSLAVEDVGVDSAGTVTYTIHNTGNAILTARQSVKVSGPFGRWEARAGRIADTPALLPGERRKLSVPVHGVTRALRLTATVTVTPLLTDAAGSTTPLTPVAASGHVVVIPWVVVLALVAVCGLVVLLIRVRRRRAVAA
jgi:uncharacterized membrane protein